MLSSETFDELGFDVRGHRRDDSSTEVKGNLQVASGFQSLMSSWPVVIDVCGLTPVRMEPTPPAAA